MRNQSVNKKFLASAIAAILSSTNGAYAQTRTDNNSLEEITVTGSRIRQTSGMTTPTPVTAITTDELSGFEPASTISEQLDALPQFFQTQTAQRGGSSLFGDASGSYLNLRGMGKNRTLVLLDGSRIVPADRGSSVNVDNIPTALIRSVDIVTGGASAAYGADALAGVVNFVLDREFEGLSLDVSTGITEQGDGENWNFSAAGGRQFGDRLHAVGSLNVRSIEQIQRNPEDLDSFKRWGWVRNPAWSPGAPVGVPQRLTMPDVHSTVHTPAGLINQPGFVFDRYTFTADGEEVRPFIKGEGYSYGGAGATNTQSGGSEASISNRAFDGGPSGNAVEQLSTFGSIKYDVNDVLSVYGQFMTGTTESKSSGMRGLPHLQSNTWYYTAFVDNVFLPDAVRQAMVDAGRDSIRIDKLGQLRGPTHLNWYDNRTNIDTSSMKSATVGFDLALPNGWDLGGSFQRGLSKVTSVGLNLLRIDKFWIAADAVRDPNTGATVCHIQVVNPSEEEQREYMRNRPISTTVPPGIAFYESPLGPGNPIENCVPLNVFGHGNVSQEAIDYVTDDKTDYRTLNQNFGELLLTGELYEGFGAGPVSFAAGLTYREEAFLQATVPVELQREPILAPELGIRGISPGVLGATPGLLQFTNSFGGTGKFDVWEGFSELNVPVWESGSGSYRLDTNMAYRSSNYSSSGRQNSWKFGGEVRVFEDLRLRITKSLDVREPSFAEQFISLGGGGTINDPEFNNTAFSITVYDGGNPSLAPEEADTLTAGFVYQPTFASWVEGLQFAVDWYEIDLAGAIGSYGEQRIVDECFSSGALCNAITRDPINGTVSRVLNVNQNISAARTEGVDVEVQYSMEPDFLKDSSEAFSIRGFAGYLKENSTTPFEGNKEDEAGGLNRPTWTATAIATYTFGPYGIRVQQRYYDSTLINVRWIEGKDVDDNTIASQTVTNLSLSYTGATSSESEWRTSLNITNLFDKEPPIVPSISTRGASQTVSNNFDIYGRRYQLSFNYSF